MAALLTRLTHRIAIQLVAESYTVFSSRSRWPVRKFLDTTSYNISLDIYLLAIFLNYIMKDMLIYQRFHFTFPISFERLTDFHET